MSQARVISNSRRSSQGTGAARPTGFRKLFIAGMSGLMLLKSLLERRTAIAAFPRQIAFGIGQFVLIERQLSLGNFELIIDRIVLGGLLSRPLQKYTNVF